MEGGHGSKFVEVGDRALGRSGFLRLCGVVLVCENGARGLYFLLKMLIKSLAKGQDFKNNKKLSVTHNKRRLCFFFHGKLMKGIIDYQVFVRAVRRATWLKNMWFLRLLAIRRKE